LNELTEVERVIDEGLSTEEILLHKKGNIYFIMSMYLKNKSWAKEVYFIEAKP